MSDNKRRLKRSIQGKTIGSSNYRENKINKSDNLSIKCQEHAMSAFLRSGLNQDLPEFVKESTLR